MKNILFLCCIFVGFLANFVGNNVVFAQKNKDDYEKLVERSNLSIKILEEKVQQLEYLQKLQLDNVREQNRNYLSKDTTYFGNMTRMVQISIKQIDENYQKQLKEVKAQKIDTQQELEAVLNVQKDKFDNETIKQNMLFLYEAIGVIALNIILFIILGAVLRGRQERFFEEISRKNTQDLKTALLAEVKELSYKELEKAIADIKNDSQKVIQKIAVTDIELENKKLQDDLANTQNQILLLSQKLQEEKTNRQNNLQNNLQNINANTNINSNGNANESISDSDLLLAQKNQIEQMNKELSAATALINKINQQNKEENIKNEAIITTVPAKNNQENAPIRREETETIMVLEPLKTEIVAEIVAEKVTNTVVEVPVIENVRENIRENQHTEEIIAEITPENTVVSVETPKITTENTVVSVETPEITTENTAVSVETPEIIAENTVVSVETPEITTENTVVSVETPEIIAENTVIETQKETTTENIAENTTEGYLTQAQKAYEERDIENAIAFYGLALAQTPDAITYTKRGNCYHLLKKLDQATADYQKAIRLDANFIAAYNNAIEIYILTDNFFQALTTLEQLARVEKMPQYKALELYLKLIVQKALNQSSEKTEKDLDEVMRFEFSFNFSFKEISDWLAYADIDPVHKRVIQNKTELLKLKKF